MGLPASFRTAKVEGVKEVLKTMAEKILDSVRKRQKFGRLTPVKAVPKDIFV